MEARSSVRHNSGGHAAAEVQSLYQCRHWLSSRALRGGKIPFVTLRRSGQEGFEADFFLQTWGPSTLVGFRQPKSGNGMNKGSVYIFHVVLKAEATSLELGLRMSYNA